ncbi:MAG: YaaA family protein [Campylobacterales bacterium]|nr:YaaA family protein [Campylobacterales bacterium]
MKILFAPSEGKRTGGNYPPINSTSLIFPELYRKRLEVIRRYEALVQQGSDEELKKLFGLKDIREFERYKIPFESAPTMKAIERYDGVAYNYLKYETLSQTAQEYIDTHVILFSNLFGPIAAGDTLPDYKLKQGSSIEKLALEKYYKEYFSNSLDNLNENKELLDLRAGFYDKFYTPKNSITTLKFLKEGKVVSHWAKAYRGVVLRALATHKTASIRELLALSIEGLSVTDIVETKKKKEVIYKIV